jgi:hypothetical protein
MSHDSSDQSFNTWRERIRHRLDHAATSAEGRNNRTPLEELGVEIAAMAPGDPQRAAITDAIIAIASGSDLQPGIWKSLCTLLVFANLKDQKIIDLLLKRLFAGSAPLPTESRATLMTTVVELGWRLTPRQLNDLDVIQKQYTWMWIAATEASTERLNEITGVITSRLRGDNKQVQGLILRLDGWYQRYGLELVPALRQWLGVVDDETERARLTRWARRIGIEGELHPVDDRSGIVPKAPPGISAAVFKTRQALVVSRGRPEPDPVYQTVH